jgi:hypothetical protein
MTTQPTLKKEFNPPHYITCNEAYSLFHFLVTGEPLKKYYFDRRNQSIHNAIESMYQNCWPKKSVDTLIHTLREEWHRGGLERAGGESYIRRLLGNFDPETDLEAKYG